MICNSVNFPTNNKRVIEKNFSKNVLNTGPFIVATCLCVLNNRSSTQGLGPQNNPKVGLRNKSQVKKIFHWELFLTLKYVCAVCARWCHRGRRKAPDPLEMCSQLLASTWVLDSALGSLEEQLVLLTTEPSLIPIVKSKINTLKCLRVWLSKSVQICMLLSTWERLELSNGTLKIYSVG